MIWSRLSLHSLTHSLTLTLTHSLNSQLTNSLNSLNSLTYYFLQGRRGLACQNELNDWQYYEISSKNLTLALTSEGRYQLQAKLSESTVWLDIEQYKFLDPEDRNEVQLVKMIKQYQGKQRCPQKTLKTLNLVLSKWFKQCKQKKPPSSTSSVTSAGSDGGLSQYQYTKNRGDGETSYIFHVRTDMINLENTSLGQRVLNESHVAQLAAELIDNVNRNPGMQHADQLMPAVLVATSHNLEQFLKLKNPLANQKVTFFCLGGQHGIAAVNTMIKAIPNTLIDSYPCRIFCIGDVEGDERLQLCHSLVKAHSNVQSMHKSDTLYEKLQTSRVQLNDQGIHSWGEPGNNTR